MKLNLMKIKSFISYKLVFIGILLVLLFYTKSTFAKENENKAKNNIQQTLEQHGPSDRYDKGAQDLMEKGEQLQKEGKYADAVSVYKTVISKYPTATYENEVSDGGTYSIDAREKITILKHCVIPRTSLFLKSSTSENSLMKGIRTAFTKKDADSIESYMACYFRVGAGESDNVWSLPPKQVIHYIMDVGNRFDWSSLSINSAELYVYANIHSMENGDDYIFYLSKSSIGWVWAGFFTSNNEVLGRLSKINLTNLTK
jgi:hypothetical protein